MTDTPKIAQVLVECSLDDVELITARLMLLGADGIEQRDASTLIKGGPKGATLVGTFEDEHRARDALEDFGADARLEWVLGDDWADAWKAHWHPMRLGRRIVVVPSWITYESAPGDVVLALDPGRAFGTGQHASTALAVAALERRLDGAPVPLVLDVGCGSGILAFAALLLGAERAVLCDVDADSVEVARENAARLGLDERVLLRVGSTGVLSERAPIVLANIEASVLIPLAPALAKLVARGGALILSGVLASQRDEVLRPYESLGFSLDRCEQEGEWIAPELVLR